MIGDLAITKGLILPNEGGQGSDGNYHKYIDSVGVPTIGYGFTSAVFPNSVFDSMPDVMTPAQADKIFEEVLGKYESWTSKVAGVANGTAKLSAHQIACMYDIEWQWGGGRWATFFNGGSLNTNADIRNMLATNSYLWQYANRSQTRLNYWDTPDPNPQPQPPDTKPAEKDKTKPNSTPQTNPNKTKPKPPKNVNKIELDGGLFYLRNNQLYKLKDHGLIMLRNNDYLTLNVAKKKTSGGTSSSSQNKNNNTSNNQTGTKPTPKPDPAKPSGNASKIETFINKLSGIQLRSLRYANIRPQQDPNVCGWSDCSGFVGFGLSDLLPEMWNGGYTNTAVMNAYVRKNNLVVGEGATLAQATANGTKRGDILLMGDDSTTGAGNNSHVVALIDPNNVTSVGYTPCPNIETLQSYSGTHGYYVIARPFP